MSDIKVDHLIPQGANTIIFSRYDSLGSTRRLELEHIRIPPGHLRVKFIQSEKAKPRPSFPTEHHVDVELDTAPGILAL